MPQNRLAQEKSPYLKQHEHNPVDWFPWGDEAFEKAARENKPVFLSIGYSTCYWCHVMEKESFEDTEVAAALNRDFVSVKVDREEHPEVDEIYMDAVLAMTGQGGWPMSLFLLPDRKPFWGGTYIPKAQLLQLSAQVVKAWKEVPGQIRESGERLLSALKEDNAQPASENLAQLQLLERFASQANQRFDKMHGGFGEAPKFPASQAHRLLLRLYHDHRQPVLLEMAEKSLTGMACGGLFDQLGGGFHRYSTDEKWLVPHFEKMLYDNALLVPTYLEAFNLTGKKLYADVARATLEYMLRDLRAPNGGFYSAEDAGEVGKEGEFYVWKLSELESALGKEFAAFTKVFPVSKDGNFEHATNVLHIDDPANWEAAQALGGAREALLGLRGRRARPHRDEKVLTGWNGLALTALALGYRHLGEERYLEAARECAGWMKKELWNGQELFRRWAGGESRFRGNSSDYAFLIQGLICLYEVTFESEWLLWARELQRTLDRDFWSEEQGAYLTAAAQESGLITRKAFLNDGAVPSPNSISFQNLLRLSQLFLEPGLDDKSALVFEAHGNLTERMPFAVPALLLGLHLRTDNGPRLLALAGTGEKERLLTLAALRKKFLPDLLLAGPGESGGSIPSLEGKKAGEPSAFLCEDGACHAPKPLESALEALK
jgi:uncharacterized protein YyaL (SSP411 family)